MDAKQNEDVKTMHMVFLRVHGMIGVGKTFFLCDIASHGITTFQEDVNSQMLSEFINGDMSAFDFQRIMMLASNARTLHAMREIKRQRFLLLSAHGTQEHQRIAVSHPNQNENGKEIDFGDDKTQKWLLCRDAFKNNRIIAAERCNDENNNFALANHAIGRISSNEYAHYRVYSQAFTQKSVHEPNKTLPLFTEEPDGATALDIFLWSPVNICQNNMCQRGHTEERKYDLGHYMHALHHYYFVRALYKMRDNLLVTFDWRHYGKYQNIKEAILSLERTLTLDDRTPYGEGLPEQTKSSEKLTVKVIYQFDAALDLATYNEVKGPVVDRCIRFTQCHDFEKNHEVIVNQDKETEKGENNEREEKDDSENERAQKGKILHNNASGDELTYIDLHFDYLQYTALNQKQRLLASELFLDCISLKIGRGGVFTNSTKGNSNFKVHKVYTYNLPDYEDFVSADWHNPLLASDAIYRT